MLTRCFHIIFIACCVKCYLHLKVFAKGDSTQAKNVLLKVVPWKDFIASKHEGCFFLNIVNYDVLFPTVLCRISSTNMC